MTHAISISNLYFKDKQGNIILNNITLNVMCGEFLVITGNNGVGKTSLLKLINGITKQTLGTIKIFEQDLNSESKKLIGYIPQTNYYSPYLPISVEEVLVTGLTIKHGIFKKLTTDNYNQINLIANKLNIKHLLSKPIGTLSGGQLQKVLIAKVLLQDAKIILMDEPLNNLDNQTQLEILKIIEDLNIHNKLTILFVTHDISKVPNIKNIKYFNLGEKQNICMNF